MIFPDEGEIFKAKKKTRKELIFFVHFYQGHKKALVRHIRFVNQLGYDAYAFNLKDELKQHYMVPYSHISKKFGMKHALADQIEEHLDLLRDHESKIMFAFSNVAASAIEAMARRPDFYFHGLICDSGPTLDFVDSAYKLFKHSQPVKALPFGLSAIPILAFGIGWSKDMHNDVPLDLQKFRDGFPVLSIRGWKDKLVTPSGIDKIFEPCQNLVWQKLSLPDAEHLTGLRDFPGEYKPAVEEFLNGLN